MVVLSKLKLLLLFNYIVTENNYPEMITIPTLLLNEQICRRNIKDMADKARRNKITLRPHFKTHQSHEIGNWFREEGTEKITVSSLRMAQYFAQDNWKDILVAFPVNILEIGTINHLARDIRLSLLIESVETVKFLQQHLNSAVSVYLKADIGFHRTGVSWDDHKTISEILKSINNSGKVAFCGFLTHAGHSYKSRSISEIQAVHDESTSRMISLKKHFIREYPDLNISIGDTPTCSTMEDFSMVDEIRPGNYVFYDVSQSIIGSCSTEQIAVAMACPVVAVHKERNEIVIYGGSVHFAKDSITDKDGITIYGRVVRNYGNVWGEVIEGSYLKKLSQEHGIVSVPSDVLNDYKAGDIIKILPVHSCTTANLMKEYTTTDGRIISRL
jgi:D-serine deaminase-like pyridoxal phosphate-dependent protein